jgi:RNA polymerase sigma factor (TIGR02999 family)
MSEENVENVTQMLIAYSKGDKSVLDSLLPLVYDELRRIAASYLAHERPDHTLQPTALVHEAYLRLVSQRNADWHNRTQFYGLAAQMMRRILVKHAETRNAQKRKGEKVSLEDVTVCVEEKNMDLLALDEALNQLASLDAEKCKIVELKFFGGLTIDEIAEVTGKSTATIEREWAFSRGWLYKAMK